MLRISSFVASIIALSCCCGFAQARERYALIDKNDKLVTQTIFSELHSVCPGLYVGQVSGEKDKHIFDTNGKVIPVKLPQGFTLCDLFTGDDDSYVPHDSLPANSCLDVQKNNLHGIADLNGNFIVKPEYIEITTIGPSKHVLKSSQLKNNQNLCRFFDSHTRRQSVRDFEPPGFSLFYANEGLFQFLVTRPTEFDNAPQNSWMHFNYCDIDGKIVFPSIFNHVSRFANGLAFVTTPDFLVTHKGRIKGERVVFRNIFIDKSGKFVAPEISPNSSFTPDGYAVAAHAENPQILGLIDRQFHFSIEPKYVSLQQMAPNLYAAKEKEGEHSIAIDSTGAKVFDLPEGKLEFDMNDQLYFPSDTIAMRVSQSTPAPGENLAPTCLIDRTGKVLIPLGGYVSYPRYGLVTESTGWNSESRSWLMNITGDILIHPQHAYLNIAESNRVIKTILTSKFELEDWQVAPSKRPRYEAFAFFLKDYNLIGMPQQKVIGLLGSGEKLRERRLKNGTVTTYTMISGECGNMWRGMEIEFQNQVVARWRFVSLEQSGPWSTKNMVLKPGSEPMRMQLIPKLPVE